MFAASASFFFFFLSLSVSVFVIGTKRNQSNTNNKCTHIHGIYGDIFSLISYIKFGGVEVLST